jgi:hypothetical protein
MNIEALRRKIQRMRATLARADDIEIRPGAGMAGLREALAVAKRAREQGLIAPIETDGGHALPRVYSSPAEAMSALRADMLAEQARRAEWLAEKSLDERMREPAIHDDDEPDDRLNGERGDAPASKESEQCPSPAPSISQDS